MAGVVVELTGDEAKLLASMQKIIAQNAKTGESFKKTGEEAKKASDDAVKEQQRIERESKKSADSIYAAHQKMLDDKARESRQYALEEEALARKTAFVEVQEALKAAEKEIDATEKILNEKKKAAQKETELAQKSKQEIADQILGFAGVSSAVGVVTVAIGQATKAFQLLAAAKAQALQTQEGLSESNRRLVQVSNSPEDLAAMQSRADNAAMGTGVSREVARQVLFSARSEGYEKDFEGILAANQVIDPLAASTVAGKVPALFGGQIGSMEAVSLGLRAAKDSNLNFEQMASSLPTAAEGGALVGASPEELFAVQGVLASRFKSGDTSADRIKAFSSSAGIDDRMKGKGIIGAFETIQAMQEKERTEFLGKNQELNAMYVILGEEMPKIQTQLKVMQEERAAFAGGGGLLRDTVKIAQADPNITNVTNVRKARVREEILKEENLAESGGSDAVARADAAALLEQKRGNLVDRLATTGVSETLGYVPGLSAQSKATMSSVVGDRASTSAKFLVSPAFGAMNMASDFFTGGGTAQAQNTIRRRVGGATDTIDQALAGGAPSDKLDAVAVATQETAKALAEQNKLMQDQNDLIKGLGNSGSSSANAIRQQSQQPRAE